MALLTLNSMKLLEKHSASMYMINFDVNFRFKFSMKIFLDTDSRHRFN